MPFIRYIADHYNIKLLTSDIDCYTIKKQSNILNQYGISLGISPEGVIIILQNEVEIRELLQMQPF